MNNKAKVILLVLVAISMLALVVYCMMPTRPTGGNGETGNGSDTNRVVKIKNISGKHIRTPRETRPRKKIERPEKPTFDLEEDEEAKLNEEQRLLIAEIRRALDAEDLKSLLKLVAKMQASEEWPDGIPVPIRVAAIQSLGWFGISGLPEIAGFLADPNAEVLSSAIEAYENALIEANGDGELSQIVIAACQMINDADAVESFLLEINNMRPSVAVETLKEIHVSGSQAAKDALPETLEFFTGEEGMTADKLDDWYNDPSGDNVDPEEAEALFGPQSND